jgi:hypothetical protein
LPKADKREGFTSLKIFEYSSGRRLDRIWVEFEVWELNDGTRDDDCGAMPAADNMPVGLDQFASGQSPSWIGDIYPGSADVSDGTLDRLATKIWYLFILPAFTGYVLATLGVGLAATAVETAITSTRGPKALAAWASAAATLRIGRSCFAS